jgi:hypothetical protein
MYTHSPSPRLNVLTDYNVNATQHKIKFEHFFFAGRGGGGREVKLTRREENKCPFHRFMDFAREKRLFECHILCCVCIYTLTLSMYTFQFDLIMKMTVRMELI